MPRCTHSKTRPVPRTASAESFWSKARGRIQTTHLQQCSGHHVRFGKIPHGLPAQPAQRLSTEPSTTSNTSYWNKLVSKGERALEHNLHFNRPLQWVSEGLQRYKKRLQEQPFWMETPPTALGSAAEGSGEGRVSWSVANTAVYGGYAFPRVCFSREHETHNFIAHFPSPPTGNFSYFLAKKTHPQNNQQPHQLRWFPTRLPSLRSSCQYRDQPGLFRQLKSGLTSSPLEWIKEFKRGENWEIF